MIQGVNSNSVRFIALVAVCCLGPNLCAQQPPPLLPGEVARLAASRGEPIAFSPNGKFVVAGVRVYDAQTFKFLRFVSVHSYKEVDCLAISPDSTLIANGGMGCPYEPPSPFAKRPYISTPIGLWNAQTGKEEKSLVDHDWWVRFLSFSPDGGKLASEGCDGIKVWELPKGKLLYSLPSGGLNGLVFSPDGSELVTWRLGAIEFRAAATGKLLRTWKEGAYDLAYGSNGSTLVTAELQEKECQVKIWDTKTGKAVRTLKTGFEIGVVTISPDGKLVAAGGGTEEVGVVRFWDAATGELRGSLEDRGTSGLMCSRVRRIAFSPDSRLLATGSYETEVRLWDVAKLLKLKP
jgi:WD40 repeat protein